MAKNDLDSLSIEELAALRENATDKLLEKVSARRAETTKCIRETEAEAVAFVVGEVIGPETNSASWDYVKLYNGGKETLAQSLEHIQRVSAEILSGITPP